MRPPDPGAFRAVRVPLAAGDDEGMDPLAAAGDDGVLFAGRFRTVVGHGTAARLDLPRGLEDPAALRAVREWLAAVPVAEPAGEVPGLAAATPVAVGALPFDRAAPASLRVPARVWCRTADGARWLMAVEPADGRDPATVAADLRAWLAATVTANHPASAACSIEHVTFHPPGAGYADAVAAAVRAIAAGHLTKVVLARAVDVRFAGDPAPGAPVGPRPGAVLERLWAGDAAFSAFAIPVAGGTFVGASPELIVARHGTTVTSLPLAGTVALPSEGDGGDGGDGLAGLAGTRSGDGATADPSADADADATAEAAVARLLASAKDLAEHRLVVDDVATRLATRCADVDVPDHPTVVRLRSDARLGTLVRARVPAAPAGPDDPADRRCDALALLAELHPTPAVGGVDRPTALAHIAAAEPVPRGYWAGPVGWVDGSGDGEWVLAIRSVMLEGPRARVHAGAGIVAGSNPELELAETSTKLSPVLDALVPGGASVLAEPVSDGPVSPPSPPRPQDPAASPGR